MARPRIFLSSTFFDLRQVRADLERFIKEVGYDTVLNETGNIPYGKDEKLEEYCYKEISQIDILVGVVGGRFGSKSDRESYSITQVEIKTAIEQNKQVYIFIEKNVLAEYQTYLINKDNKSIKYRFVDDVRVYNFIEEIYALPKNNIVHPFETALDITIFLKEQRAGLFRDLLNQQTRRGQYENIQSKVDELTEVFTTLKTYLESVLESVFIEKKDPEKLISKEKKRLEQFQLYHKLQEQDYILHLIKLHHLKIEQIIEALKRSKSLTEFKTLLNEYSSPSSKDNRNEFACMFRVERFEEINKAREVLGLPIYELNEDELRRIQRRSSIAKIKTEKD